MAFRVVDAIAAFELKVARRGWLQPTRSAPLTVSSRRGDSRCPYVRNKQAQSSPVDTQFALVPWTSIYPGAEARYSTLVLCRKRDGGNAGGVATTATERRISNIQHRGFSRTSIIECRLVNIQLTLRWGSSIFDILQPMPEFRVLSRRTTLDIGFRLSVFEISRRFTTTAQIDCPSSNTEHPASRSEPDLDHRVSAIEYPTDPSNIQPTHQRALPSRISTLRRRFAFVTTLIELSAIAASAMAG